MDTAELSGLRIDLRDDVYLRTVREQDADGVLELVTRNYDHLRTFMEWAKPDYSDEDAKDWIEKSVREGEKGNVLNLLICSGGMIIGTIGFAYFDHDAKVTEIGYWIDGQEQGRGIMSHAAEKLVDLAFEKLGMNRVQIRCADANTRSAAIPRKLGFVEEGRQRRHVVRDGKTYDFLIFRLLRDEWLSRQNA
jgi:ribosomal-protein-serine acetyltransferase